MHMSDGTFSHGAAQIYTQLLIFIVLHGLHTRSVHNYKLLVLLPLHLEVLLVFLGQYINRVVHASPNFRTWLLLVTQTVFN